MLHHHRRPVRVQVTVAPLHQRDHHRPEVDPLLGEPVLVPWRALLVGAPLEDPLLDQPLQPRLQHVPRDPEVPLEVVEAANAEEGVADDQERPALADDLERSRDRADLVLVAAAEHLHTSLAA